LSPRTRWPHLMLRSLAAHRIWPMRGHLLQACFRRWHAQDDSRQLEGSLARNRHFRCRTASDGGVRSALRLHGVEESFILWRSCSWRRRRSKLLRITKPAEQAYELRLRGVRGWFTAQRGLVNARWRRFGGIVDKIVNTVVRTCCKCLGCNFPTDSGRLHCIWRGRIQTDKAKDRSNRRIHGREKLGTVGGP
jgi:hypothetical protein